MLRHIFKYLNNSYPSKLALINLNTAGAISSLQKLTLSFRSERVTRWSQLLTMESIVCLVKPVASIHFSYNTLQEMYDRNASVNSSSAHPPPGNPGAFPNVVRPGGGAFAYLGLTPGHLTRSFETVRRGLRCRLASP